ncbi:hypothetical protein [Bacillus wiedmannii]|uniref:hypothetical protein n=1 Tax=Bacillus wiedmannii TaxID=1890302 RepID=UPI000B434847|nr:hypothetical protein [Bacillus wiedmannii]OUB81193.1 hypothetical protein BK788_24090 [Bacillus thuringiensis serovar sinensis]
MTNFAFHPVTHEKISIEEWQRKYMEETPICAVCNKSMYVRAKASDMNTHFAHFKGSDCPLLAENHKRYEHLTPREKDYANAKKIKQTVLNNLWVFYLKCQEAFGEGFRQQDFKSVLEKANEINIWLYKGLTVKHVPYVLLVNYGVFEKKPYRDEKVHFIFDANLSNYDDLWNKPKVIRQKMWKVFPKKGDINEIKMDFSSQGLAPEYFISYITKIDGNALKW